MAKKKPQDRPHQRHEGPPESVRKSLQQLFDDNPGKGFNFRQIARAVPAGNKAGNEALFAALEKLENTGKIKHLPNGNYVSSRKGKSLTGRVDHVHPRFAYIVTGIEGQKDIYVKTRDLDTALHGDTVEVELLTRQSGESPEGKVVNIVQRARNRFVGRLELSKNYAFVVPDFKKIYQDFFIYPENTNHAQANDKVVIEVTRWGDGDRSPEARVIEILGKTGENEAEIHSIMAEFDLPFRFPEPVLQASEAIAEGITPEEIERRRDFRGVPTFTIDPEDAKDFDDAISFRTLGNGRYEVGVHIADVTHYVRPGTVLEEEAFNRATSVYLVDRTVPMLPERLSNHLCSLRPHEEKLTFSAVFEMDAKAKIHQTWYGRTVIYSNHRFTYEQAQEVIETASGPFADELKILNGLHHQLRTARYKKGAVNFETSEVKFKLDEHGKPLAVVPKVRKDAHKLIEEFMLLANRGVATFIFNRKQKGQPDTFVYRTHDAPDYEKVSDFARFASQFGHKLLINEQALSKSLNKLMDDIEGRPEQNVLQSLAVRTMAKAKYTTEPKGHFGLAFEHYTHFTSPIRRYPDMLVHRLLQHYLADGKSVNPREYEEKCIHASEREKRAADAERASIKYKQVEFMSMQADKPCRGLISGVTDFGIFVEIIDTKCEGMVRLADLKDDFYEYDERAYRVIGRRRKKIYQLGDEVTVRVKKCDVDRRLIDLAFD